jgi:hypothetical protein
LFKKLDFLTTNSIRRKIPQYSIYIHKFNYSPRVAFFHIITPEAILEEYKKAKYSLCIAGAMNCPPGDWGGVHGFYENLEALSDKSSDDYEEIAEWMGEDYDPNNLI